MIWSHLRILREKARERAVIHTGRLWNDVSQKVSNDFICYLMNRYELYYTFSIIMVSPAPDWDSAAACHGKPLTAGASSARDLFLRSAFLETADQTSQSYYRPIIIGTQSIGAPLIYIKTCIYVCVSICILSIIVYNLWTYHLLSLNCIILNRPAL